jgi:cell division protein FtsA
LAKDTFYTAVDLGTSKICTIVSRVGSEGELKILGTGIVPSQGMQKGRIERLDEVQAAVRSSLEEAQRYISQGAISGVYVSVSGSHITCLNTKNVLDDPGDHDGITPQQLNDLLQSSYPQVDASQEVLHIIPIGYEVDGLPAVRNPEGLHANQVEVESHVVLGDAATLKNTVKAVEASKVSVKSLVVQSLASAEATLTGDEREMGVVLVDIGGGTANLAIFREGNPWYSAVIPVGGNQFSRDLAVALRIPFYLAEELKIKWGHAMVETVKGDEEVVVPSFQGQPRRIIQRKELCEPLEARLAEMLKLVLLRVRQAGLRQMPTGGLVLTGGCAEIPGLQDFASKTLGGPVRIGYPRGIAGLPPQLQKPSFSTAVGLLLWGIKHQGESRAYRNGESTPWGYKSLVHHFQRARETILHKSGRVLDRQS